MHGIELTTFDTGNIVADTLRTDNTGATLRTTGAGSIAVNTLDIAGDINLQTASGTITATGITSRAGSLYVTGGGAVSVGSDNAGRIELSGTTIAGNNLTARNSLKITTGGALTANNLTTGDDLTISANSVDLKALNATFSGGIDDGGDGSPISGSRRRACSA